MHGVYIRFLTFSSDQVVTCRDHSELWKGVILISKRRIINFAINYTSFTRTGTELVSISKGSAFGKTGTPASVPVGTAPQSMSSSTLTYMRWSKNLQKLISKANILWKYYNQILNWYHVLVQAYFLDSLSSAPEYKTWYSFKIVKQHWATTLMQNRKISNLKTTETRSDLGKIFKPERPRKQLSNRESRIAITFWDSRVTPIVWSSLILDSPSKVEREVLLIKRRKEKDLLWGGNFDC